MYIETESGHSSRIEKYLHKSKPVLNDCFKFESKILIRPVYKITMTRYQFAI